MSPAAAAKTAQSGDEKAAATAYRRYDETLRAYQAVDFDDLIALPIDLLDAAVITEDNLVVAARNPAAIGRQIQDPAWLAARKSQTGSLTPALEQGRQVLILVEPLRQQARIIGWVRLVLAAPRDVAAVRSNEDLIRDVGVVIVPLFILTAGLVMLLLRGIMSQIRSRIGRILLDAMDDSRHPLEKTGGVV